MGKVIKKVRKGNSYFYYFKINNILDKLYYQIKSAGSSVHLKNERKVYPIKEGIVMFYVVSGCVEIITGSYSTFISDGELAFINCYNHYSLYHHSDANVKWLQIDGCNVSEFCQTINYLNGNLFNREFVQEKPIRIMDKYSNIEEFINYLFKQLEEYDDIEELLISVTLYYILCKSLSEFMSRDLPKYNDMLYDAMKYIDENLGQKLTLAEITSEVGISPSALNKLFNDKLKISPYNYIQERRMEKAKILLRKTDKSIFNICEECGFNYLPNFTKSFIKYNGMTPSHYRKGEDL